MIIYLVLKDLSGYLFFFIVFDIFYPRCEKMVRWMRLVAMGLKGRSRFQRNLPIRIDRSNDCLYIENEGG